MSRPGRHEIRAELVATVLDVTVSVGDLVQPGRQICLLESMKMEIPVLSEVSGFLTDALVTPGQVVRCGDVLAVLHTNSSM
ncbi:biotin/lipoyl-binding carrier protein [Pseudonocardia sp. HH130630-07]|uniref:biotin/lipoyl-binding carrier protein n=1 Tax=Pseudonocardia sp. HH130630-07 TaxID=1690815 RepID=UPI000814C2F4|nr:biotin/lipoyl-binding carrier protein [Pseudonocardia sp. HH130630-07]ANY10838.1 hypothetical protein AFB00_31085 [Pseudonocardia sp. HH130630-07]